MERISVREAGLSSLLRIRGHHLNNLISLYRQARCDGLELSYSGYKRPIPPEIDELVKKWAFLVSEAAKSASMPFGYDFDVLGRSERDKRMFIKKLSRNAIGFIAASPEDQVLLTRTPDFICSACKVGSHCLNPSFNPDAGTDAGAIAAYVRDIQTWGSSVESFYEKCAFSGEDVPVVLSNFGDLRTYFTCRIACRIDILEQIKTRLQTLKS